MESDPTKLPEDRDDLGYWSDDPTVTEEDQDTAAELAAMDHLRTPISEHIMRAQQGDEAALEELMQQYEGMVHRYAYKHFSPDLSYEDRVQNGRIGLWRAVERFTFDGVDSDDVVGVRKRFFVHARWHVVGYIKRGNANGNESGLSVGEYWQAQKLRRTAESIYEREGEEPSDEELAMTLGWQAEQVVDLRPHTHRPKSLDEPLSTDQHGNMLTLLDTLESSDDPEEVQRNLELRDGVGKAICELLGDSEAIIRLSYGIGNGRELGLREIGKILGISRQTVLNHRNEAHAILEPLLRAYFELDENEAAG